MTDNHTARRLEKALADDARTHELGIGIRVQGDRLVAYGEVASAQRRDAVVAVLQEHEPDAHVSDQITISADAVDPPRRHELIQPPHS